MHGLFVFKAAVLRKINKAKVDSPFWEKRNQDVKYRKSDRSRNYGLAW